MQNPMTFSLNRKVMHTTEIKHFHKPNQMALIIQAFWKTMVSLWGIPTTIVSTLGIKIFGYKLFLTIFGVDSIASTITAACLAVSSLIGLLFIYKQKNAEAEKLENELTKMKDDRYMERVEWLFTKGYLIGTPKKADIDKLIAEYFPEP